MPIAERMAQGTDGTNGATFRRADNKRTAGRGAMGGWDQLRGRLTGDEDGRPMLFFFDTCIHTIRTLPALQHDEANPEDLNSDQEDHAADETRYACMSRPWAAKSKTPDPKVPPGHVKLPGPPEGARGRRIAI